jgi:hypothetical protein
VREASRKVAELETAARKVAMAAEAHEATAADLAQRLPALKAEAKVHWADAHDPPNPKHNNERMCHCSAALLQRTALAQFTGCSSCSTAAQVTRPLASRRELTMGTRLHRLTSIHLHCI